MSKMSWFSRAQYNRLKYERLADDVLRLESQEAGEQQEDELSWFRRVTASLALVYLSSHPPGGEEDGGESEISDPNSSTPETQLVSRETALKLHESIEELPEESRNLIKAAYFEGLTLQDAGKRLGVSKSWASRMHAKALQRLAIALRGIGEASG